jgi:hypothetical protein
MHCVTAFEGMYAYSVIVYMMLHTVLFGLLVVAPAAAHFIAPAWTAQKTCLPSLHVLLLAVKHVHRAVP